MSFEISFIVPREVIRAAAGDSFLRQRLKNQVGTIIDALLLDVNATTRDIQVKALAAEAE